MYQRCMLGLTYGEIASRLSVDPSTVWRAVQRFEEHGTVDSCYTHEGPPKVLDEFSILEAVINRPAIHLCEFQRLVEQTTGTTISDSVICRTETTFRVKSSSVWPDGEVRTFERYSALTVHSICQRCLYLSTKLGATCDMQCASLATV